MKNIVITGSTRGIGLAMALEFLKSGCQVTLSGRKEKLSKDTQSLLERFADHYIYVPCNVQDENDVQKLWDLSMEHWHMIDIWINNAGQNTPHMFIWETEKNHTDDVISTNILGMIYGSQVAAKGMLAQGSGAIYSMEGLGSNNMIQKKTILYGTTKHALTYFMKGLAKELKDTPIIVGRLSPGIMLTDFITKTPDGAPSTVLENQSFKKVFNILADRPETVAKFFIPKMLKNTKENVQIAWLTPLKATWRFLTAAFRKNRFLS